MPNLSGKGVRIEVDMGGGVYTSILIFFPSVIFSAIGERIHTTCTRFPITPNNCLDALLGTVI